MKVGKNIGKYVLILFLCNVLVLLLSKTLLFDVLWIALLISFSLAVMVSLVIDKLNNITVATIVKNIHDMLFEKTNNSLPGNTVHMPREIDYFLDKISSKAKEFTFKIKRLTREKTEYFAVLEKITHGVVAVDKNLTILLANSVARELFKVKGEAYGKYFLEVFIESRLERALKSSMDKGVDSMFIIHTKLEEPKILKIEINVLLVENEIFGAMIQMNDITEIIKLEMIRSEFAANVSHELKTPLTSIKGFVDTLLDLNVDDKETTEKFLKIIRIETVRLSRLINDILSLSEIESKKKPTLIRKVNLTSLTKEVIEIMETQAKVKNISLECNLQNYSSSISGNADHIKQMLINLIDNAIKYTASGGKVYVSLLELDSFFVFKIRDTGIGIEKEHLQRIFERFYRVDKGRSRDMGGTGLGLAIVKHIAKSMNGYVEVESSFGKGTEFSVYLPIR